MLLLLLAPQGATPGSAGIVDLRDVVAELYPQLGSSGASDLVFWTEAELYRAFDDAAKRLARNAACWVERDTSIETAGGTVAYALPARHLSTIHVSLAGASLRPATIEELEALSNTWQEDEGAAFERFVQQPGLAAIVLYPVTEAEDGLAIVEHEFPPAVSIDDPGLNCPRVLRDYFRFAAQAAARGKESKAAMPEVAAWLRQLTGMYEEVARELWGQAQ